MDFNPTPKVLNSSEPPLPKASKIVDCSVCEDSKCYLKVEWEPSWIKLSSLPKDMQKLLDDFWSFCDHVQAMKTKLLVGKCHQQSTENIMRNEKNESDMRTGHPSNPLIDEPDESFAQPNHRDVSEQHTLPMNMTNNNFTTTTDSNNSNNNNFTTTTNNSNNSNSNNNNINNDSAEEDVRIKGEADIDVDIMEVRPSFLTGTDFRQYPGTSLSFEPPMDNSSNLLPEYDDVSAQNIDGFQPLISTQIEHSYYHDPPTSSSNTSSASYARELIASDKDTYYFDTTMTNSSSYTFSSSSNVDKHSREKNAVKQPKRSYKRVNSKYTGQVSSPFVYKPSIDEIKQAIVYFSGPVLNYRGFKKYAPNKIRSLLKPDFIDAVKVLETEGISMLQSIILPKKTCLVVVKKPPDSLPVNFPYDHERYRRQYFCTTNRSITAAMRSLLVEKGFVQANLFIG